MIERVAEVRAIQAAIKLELATHVPGTYDYEYAMRRGFTRQLVGVLAHVIDSGLIRGQLMSKEELPRARGFLAELGRTRLYSDYAGIHEIDKQLQKAINATISCVRTWVDESERVYAREYREIRERYHEQERQDKLMRRRIARIEKVLEAGPAKPPKKCKKEKHEPAPMCEKCNKRPVAKDGLCTPCFTWEKNKLGRA